MSFLHRCILAGFVAFLLGGCASLAYLPGQQTIGRLRVIGPNVRVNNTPAYDGQIITSGDQVATGAESTAYIYFLSGGLIQLDENTDPGFKLVWEKTNCIFLILNHKAGQAYQQTKPDECRTLYATPFGKWLKTHTKFNVVVNQNQTVMTVLEGEMELISPQHIIQEQGQQMIVTKAGVQSVRKLSGQELRQVTRWRDRFPPPDAGGSSGRCGECAD